MEGVKKKHVFEDLYDFVHLVDNYLWSINQVDIDWSNYTLKIYLSINDQFGRYSTNHVIDDKKLFFEYTNGNKFEKVNFIKKNTNFDALKQEYEDNFNEQLNKYKKGSFDMEKEKESFLSEANKFINYITERLKGKEEKTQKTETTINGNVDALKDYELDPSGSKKGKNKMKENEVAVRFYQGFITKENIVVKDIDGKDVKLARVKIPNDDPNDKQPRRSFACRESLIGTDLKNPNMRYVYLKKDKEYRVIRKNFDAETKKSEIIEDIKMTGQAIADTFQTERDREYAEWKAKQVKENPVAEATPTVAQVLDSTDGIEM